MLSRSITPLHATALVVGIIIGASIFVQPSVITGAVPGVGAVYAVWIVSGLLTLCGALIAAELASAFPRAGGVYVFLREAYSPALGFLWGWAMFWTMHTGIIAVIAMIFARYVAFFVPVGDAGQRAIAVGAIVLLTGINYAGVRQGSIVQTTLTILKVGAVAAIIAVVFALGHSPVAASAAHAAMPAAAPAAVATTKLGISNFSLGIVAGLFAFGGWHMVTYAAEEITDPERTIPRALVVGVLVVTASYVALNAAYFHVLTPDAIARSTRVAADAADAVLGRGGAAVMSAIVVISTFGAVNGVILAGPRAYLAMARDKLLVSWAAAVHPRYHTPHRALVLQGVWAVVLVSTGTYRALFTRVVYTEWIFFALMAIGLMRLRRRPTYAPAYRVWGYPVVPIVFAACSAYIVGNQLVTDPAASRVGLLFVLAGLPVYYLWLRKPTSPLPAAPPTRHAD
ncbi:MAG TPA: amino acid permease [Gemmatimonadaceae bacterium]|nr:amino acid permease [Gemmatimonadaceae bacterium]